MFWGTQQEYGVINLWGTYVGDGDTDLIKYRNKKFGKDTFVPC